jgi:predicted nucleic acid-binding protein
LLDACVLHPMAMADALMSLAVAGLYAAKWTRLVETEWMKSLALRRPDLESKLGHRRDQMRTAVPDWEVPEPAWRAKEKGLVLPDPGDVHVLAAAMAARADCIVTANLRDFPASTLGPLKIEAIHPDAFIVAPWELDTAVAASAFKRMRTRWKKPEATVEEFAAALDRGGLPGTALRWRESAASI